MKSQPRFISMSCAISMSESSMFSVGRWSNVLSLELDNIKKNIRGYAEEK